MLSFLSANPTTNPYHDNLSFLLCVSTQAPLPRSEMSFGALSWFSVRSSSELQSFSGCARCQLHSTIASESHIPFPRNKNALSWILVTTAPIHVRDQHLCADCESCTIHQAFKVIVAHLYRRRRCYGCSTRTCPTMLNKKHQHREANDASATAQQQQYKHIKTPCLSAVTTPTASVHRSSMSWSPQIQLWPKNSVE